MEEKPKLKPKSTPEGLLGIGLFVLFFFVLAGFDVYQYIKTTEIYETTISMSADFIDINTTEHRKRGAKIVEYHITYQFKVNPSVYTGTFAASEGNAKELLDENSIRIRYDKNNPKNNFLDTYTEDDSSLLNLLWDIVKSFFIAVLVGFILSTLIAHKLGWIKVEDYEAAD